MPQFFEPFVHLLIGVAMASFGLIHSARSLPGAEHLHGFWAALPSLGAVGLFGVGVIAVTAGLTLLVRGVQGLRRRARQLNRLYRPADEPAEPRRHHPNYDEEYDPRYA